MRRAWLPFWLASAVALALAACGDSQTASPTNLPTGPGPAPMATVEQPASIETPAVVPTETPAAAVETPALAPPSVPLGDPPVIPAALLPRESGLDLPYGGRMSLEVAILYADVIARVTLQSTATSTAQIDYTGPPQTFWLALLEFNFTVHEYLKGSGGNTISGLVNTRFLTEARAQAAAAAMPDAHDSRWDDREAVVFLFSRDYPFFGTGDYQLRAGQYWFGQMFRRTADAGINDTYTVSSIHSKKWLPEASGGGTVGQSSAKSFLLDVPSGVAVAGTASTRAALFTPDPPPATEITLADLKSKIATLETEANAGGTDAYYQCIQAVYSYENGSRYSRLRDGSPSPKQTSSAIGSGLPAGTFVQKHGDYEAPTKADVANMAWFEGATRDLVRFDNVDFRTGMSYAVRFTRNMVTARPLPAGSYMLYPHGTWHGGRVCRYPDSARNLWIHTLDVTAPTGTLHEAFFDPVAIGSAVGADGSNGVLDPADFSLDGTTTTISNLKWEAGTVTMTLSPNASLVGYAIDFIALDGSVTSTLAFDDATQSGGTLTWSVPNQPWNAGDKLMLRIRPQPSIAISGLDASIEAGRSDAFTVSASNMATTTSYGIRVTTDDPDIGFDTTCADRQEDATVPAASASHSAAFTLRACSATGGTVTATLLEGTTAVATTTRDVTVTAPPPPPPHAPAPTGLSVDSSTQTTIRVSWNTVRDAHRYKLERSADGSSGWSSVDDGISGTSHTLSGLSCNTTVHFRVSARGDGTPYSTTFGSPSTSVSGTTGDCPTTPVATPTPTPTAPSPPVFASSTYSFTVAENASAFHVVGQVSAVDPDGGVVTYAIVAGNGEGKFNITHNAGEIVVRGSLDHDTTSSYALTVRATDSSGATSTAAVNITVTEAP